MSSRYWRRPVMDIPVGQSRFSGYQERTHHSVGWGGHAISVQFHDTIIVEVWVTQKKIIINHGGWETVATQRHINDVIERLRQEFWWIPPIEVYRKDWRFVVTFPWHIPGGTTVEFANAGWQVTGDVRNNR